MAAMIYKGPPHSGQCSMSISEFQPHERDPDNADLPVDLGRTVLTCRVEMWVTHWQFSQLDPGTMAQSRRLRVRDRSAGSKKRAAVTIAADYGPRGSVPPGNRRPTTLASDGVRPPGRSDLGTFDLVVDTRTFPGVELNAAAFGTLVDLNLLEIEEPLAIEDRLRATRTQ